MLLSAGCRRSDPLCVAHAQFPAHPFEPRSPAYVLRVVQFDGQNRISRRLGRLTNKLHSRFLRGATAFAHIAGQAGANHVVPRRLAPATPRQHVIDTQLACRKMTAAILANMTVAGKHVPPAQMHLLARNPIVPQQPNDPRGLNLEGYRANPVIVSAPRRAAALAPVEPGIEGELGELAVFAVDNLRQSATEQAKRPPHIDHAHGDVAPIQDQNTRFQRARPGRRLARRNCVGGLCDPRWTADFRNTARGHGSPLT